MSLKLFVSDKLYHIVSSDLELRIQKSNGEIETFNIVDGKTKNGRLVSRLDSTSIQFHCLFKWISLKSGVYLIIVKEIEQVPAIALPNSKKSVIKVKRFSIISPSSKIERGEVVNSVSIDRDEFEYLSLIEKTLSNGGYFYYGSNNWDISKRFFGLSTSERFDTEHFCWNYESFIKISNPDITPSFIRGYAKTYETGHNDLRLAILSRVCSKRAGTRYNMRGVDSEGYAANSVETEQILINKEIGNVYSFLQIRGSIPVSWTQYTTLKYDPPIIIDASISDKMYTKYMESQLKRYGKIVSISLVNTKGFEKPLSDWYAKVVENHANDNVQFVPFDFNKECKGIKHENIDKILWPLISKNVDSFDYHVRNTKTMEIIQKQTGVTRVNCKDSLDRTNVILSITGRKIFEKWLRLEENGSILKENESLQNAGKMWSAYRYAWADNGDAISTLYAGTGALKSDITRTGRRTFYGIWQDFTNSLTRYYKNNFSDGEKQDGVNLITGNYVVDKNNSPFNSVYRGRLIHNLLTFTLVSALILLVPRKNS